MGLRQFIDNLRYLGRYNIKSMQNDVLVVKNGLDFMKYEINDDLKSLAVPKILDTRQTIDYLLEHSDKSLARFGDGEVFLIKNQSIPFQTASPELSKRLTEVLTSKNDKVEIGLPNLMCLSVRDYDMRLKDFTRRFWGANSDWLIKQIDLNRTYLNTAFTAPTDDAEILNGIRMLWKDKDITVICGDRVIKKVKYNVFDCAKSVEYIYAPTVNAFDKYDEILLRAKSVPKDRLICIVLGPTATVLAYDLALLGYRALDIGHVVKSYDLFLSNNGNIDMDDKQFAAFWAKD